MSEQKCPDCDSSIPVPDDSVDGEIVTCPDCGLDLEVTETQEGRKLKPFVTEKEDWGE